MKGSEIPGAPLPWDGSPGFSILHLSRGSLAGGVVFHRHDLECGRFSVPVIVSFLGSYVSGGVCLTRVRHIMPSSRPICGICWRIDIVLYESL